MKNLNVKIKGIALSVMLLLATNSCNDDILDTKPLGIATIGDITVGGQEAAVFGLYGQFRTTSVGDWTRYWIQNIRSDDAAKGSSPGDAAALGNVFNNFQYVASDGMIAGWWNDHYKIIYATNQIINEIIASGATDTGNKINLGEAKVIRAFLYFELRRDYGSIPLVTNTVSTPADAIKAKSPISEIDALIKSDLEYAAANLPTTWSSVYTGRATKGFANSMLAKLYQLQGDNANALLKAQEVINSGVYSLEPSFKKLFSEDGNNCSESIFEIQKLKTASTTYSNNYYESQGVRGSGVWDLGWGFNVPTPSLVAAFETGDIRKGESILESGQDDGGYGSGILPGFPPLDQQYWNKKAYTEQAKRTFYSENKNHWENIKLVRYADILLIAAEAAVNLGQTAVAQPYLNLVRSRAGLANVPATLAAIKQERRVELAMENERFYDLVRWGDANSVLGGLGYQPKNALLPIPQSAIDQSGGVLVQNPNY